MQGTLGIRREDKNRWERRAPLTPTQIEELLREHDLRVIVQPSTIRVFPDADYVAAGAAVGEDLSECNVVLGIKEMPVSFLGAGGAYVFFSHTVKGQPANMPMLRRLMELGCHLLDYEKIADEAGRRLISFGRWAGVAGMIDALWAVGRKLAACGLDSPFGTIRRTVQYASLAEAQAAVRESGEQIRQSGLAPELTPYVCGFAGYGNVSQGAQEIFDLLPFEEASPAQLLDPAWRPADPAHQLVKVVFKEDDMVAPRGSHPFELQDYYDHPERYEGIFERYLPRLDLLMNCIYWEQRYPRLVTKEGLRRLYRAGTSRNLVIGDVSCDLHGGVEITVRTTEADAPAFTYDPLQGSVNRGPDGPGVVVVAVDNLPGEVPVESSTSFGRRLVGFVPELARVDFTAPFNELQLCRELRDALILHQGRLTPPYEYLSDHVH